MFSLLTIRFLKTRSFLNHRLVPLENVSVQCDKKFSTKNRDVPVHRKKHFEPLSFLKPEMAPL